MPAVTIEHRPVRSKKVVGGILADACELLTERGLEPSADSPVLAKLLELLAQVDTITTQAQPMAIDPSLAAALNRGPGRI